LKKALPDDLGGAFVVLLIYPLDMLTLLGKIKSQLSSKKSRYLNKVKIICEYINLLRRR
jgi:hypothetical protein